MKYYLQGAGVALCLVLVALGSWSYYNEYKETENKIIEENVFKDCVFGVPTRDIEYRRACGKAAYAFAHGKKDYEVYGQTYTWDKEARIYVVKEGK